MLVPVPLRTRLLTGVRVALAGTPQAAAPTWIGFGEHGTEPATPVADTFIAYWPAIVKVQEIVLEVLGVQADGSDGFHVNGAPAPPLGVAVYVTVPPTGGFAFEGVQETAGTPAAATVMAVQGPQLFPSFDSLMAPLSPAEALSAQARTYQVPADGKE